MNFWDLTKSPPRGSREVFAGRKKYGQKFFKKFIRTHDYYFVELPDKKEKFLPMGYFRSPSEQKYKSFKKIYKGRFTEYFNSCKLIDSVISNFDYRIFEIRHDTLFKQKEFPQFCILIKELYEHGSYNYPCWRFGEDKLIHSHPGQHLNFCKIYLGLPIRGWISFPKDQTSKCMDYLQDIKIIKTIKNSQDIIDILGTDEISACIQDYNNQMVPCLYPKIPRPVWSDYDRFGNTDWPWDNVWQFNQYLESTSYIKIIDAILDDITLVDEFVHVKQHFASKTILINNFFAFLLTEQHEDKNFKLK